VRILREIRPYLPLQAKKFPLKFEVKDKKSLFRRGVFDRFLEKLPSY